MTSIRPFPIESATPPRAWSTNDIERVRRAVGEWASRANGRRGPENLWLPALLETMLGTAGRISEALALSWDRVHLDVERPWVRIDRCVREPKRGPHTVGPTKSGDVPDLEIPSFLVVVLLQLRPPHPGQSPVFATSKGTWLRPSAAHRAFRSALDAAGIDRSVERHLRPHGARKTAATAIAREAGLEEAAAQLGHVGTHTAQRHYIEPEKRAIITNGAILQSLASPPA